MDALIYNTVSSSSACFKHYSFTFDSSKYVLRCPQPQINAGSSTKTYLLGSGKDRWLVVSHGTWTPASWVKVLCTTLDSSLTSTLLETFLFSILLQVEQLLWKCNIAVHVFTVELVESSVHPIRKLKGDAEGWDKGVIFDDLRMRLGCFFVQNLIRNTSHEWFFCSAFSLCGSDWLAHCS